MRRSIHVWGQSGARGMSTASDADTHCSIGSSNSEKYKAPKQPVLGPQSVKSQGDLHQSQLLQLSADMRLHQESKLAGKLHLRPQRDTNYRASALCQAVEDISRSPHVGTGPAAGARALCATPATSGQHLLSAKLHTFTAEDPEASRGSAWPFYSHPEAACEPSSEWVEELKLLQHRLHVLCHRYGQQT